MAKKMKTLNVIKLEENEKINWKNNRIYNKIL